MNATKRRLIAARLLHTVTVSTGGVVAVTAAGHSTFTFIALAIVIAVTGLPALAREWFWYTAIRRPARNLYRIHQLTGGKEEDTERLIRVIQDGENNVLTARAAASDRADKHQAP